MRRGRVQLTAACCVSTILICDFFDMNEAFLPLWAVSETGIDERFD